MPQPTNKITEFWQELKRRKVFRVIAMYAATAFIIMEAGEIMLPRLGLPDWTVTFIIVLIIIGFPITVILSWIFDITPEGVKKTESIEIAKEQEPPSVPVKRRLKVSDVIIAVLVVVVVILAYPKVFKIDKFEEIRDPDGKFSIAVMPFDNLTGDPSLNYWQRGISELLINDLGTSSELSVLSSQTMYEVVESMGKPQTASIIPSIAKEAASKVNAGTHIIGNYQKTSNKIRILINLIDTKSGKVLWTDKVDGNLDSDYIDLTDSLSNLVKNYLEIKSLEQEAGFDYREAFPTSSEAYRYYIEGLQSILEMEYTLAIESLKKAYEIDSSFTFAAFYIAWAHSYGRYWGDLGTWVQKAYNGKDKLPIKYQHLLELWKACYVSKNRNDILKYCDLLSKCDLNSRLLLLDLGVNYHDFLFQHEKAIKIFKKIENINLAWGNQWEYLEYYNYFGQAYHKTGKHKEEEALYKIGLKISPNDSAILLNRCVCAVSQNDTLKAEEYITKFFSVVTRVKAWEAYQERLKGMIYFRADHFEQAISHIRRAVELDPQNNWYVYLLGRNLIACDINVDEGLEIIQNFLKKYPGNARLLWAEAKAYLKQGEYEKALNNLEQVKKCWATYNHEMDQEIQQAEQALANQNK